MLEMFNWKTVNPGQDHNDLEAQATRPGDALGSSRLDSTTTNASTMRSSGETQVNKVTS